LLTEGFGGDDELQGLLPQTSAKCTEISPEVKPFAVEDNTIPSTYVSRRWRFLMICGSKLLLVSRGTSISTARLGEHRLGSSAIAGVAAPAPTGSCS
jgi:hypothetical protein